MTYFKEVLLWEQLKSRPKWLNIKTAITLRILVKDARIIKGGNIMETIKELTEMAKRIYQALEICYDMDRNCQGCPYHKYGGICCVKLNSDMRMVLGHIMTVAGCLETRETAPVPENLDEMLDKNKQAWEEWADELQKARVKQLEQENAELKAKLDRIYAEQLKDLKEKQEKLKSQMEYAKMMHEIYNKELSKK